MLAQHLPNIGFAAWTKLVKIYGNLANRMLISTFKFRNLANLMLISTFKFRVWTRNKKAEDVINT